MKLKKFGIILLAVLLAGSMTACKKSDSEPEEKAKTEKNIDKDTDEKDKDNASNQKTGDEENPGTDDNQKTGDDKNPGTDDKNQKTDDDNNSAVVKENDTDKKNDSDENPGESSGITDENQTESSDANQEEAEQFLQKLTDAIMNGGTVNLGTEKLTKEQKETIKKAVEAEGGEIRFNDDGSVSFVSGEMECIIDNSGKIMLTDGDGNVIYNISRSSKWPDLPIAKGMPVPEGDFTVLLESENQIAATVMDMNYEQAEQYTQALKNAGFTNEVSEEFYEDFEMLSFMGTNADGVTASFTYMGSLGGASVLLEK